jgi:hypothetical protein
MLSSIFLGTLTGALLAVWIVLCILVGVFFSSTALGSLCCIIDPSENLSRTESFIGFLFCGFIAILCFTHVWCLISEDKPTPNLPATRDILLTVPEESSVNAQVTSENNTVNITDL